MALSDSWIAGSTRISHFGQDEYPEAKQEYKLANPQNDGYLRGSAYCSRSYWNGII